MVGESSPGFSFGLPPVSQGFGKQFGRVAVLRTGHRVPVETPGTKSKVGAETWQYLHALSACVVVLLRDPGRREPTSPLWWPHIDCGARCNSRHCLGMENSLSPRMEKQTLFWCPDSSLLSSALRKVKGGQGHGLGFGFFLAPGHSCGHPTAVDSQG